jgi:chromosome segregation and condensation protein ScpB
MSSESLESRVAALFLDTDEPLTIEELSKALALQPDDPALNSVIAEFARSHFIVDLSRRWRTTEDGDAHLAKIARRL